MFCRNCGNGLNESDLFCSSCGTKKDIQQVQTNILNTNNQQNIKLEDNNEKSNPILSNLVVFFMFIANMVLLFMGIVISFIKDLQETSAASGWFLIIIPVIAIMFLLPHIVGLILSGINLKIKNYIMLIFTFIASLFCVFSTLLSHDFFLDSNMILFWICLILSVVLSVILLLKVILKIKK